MASDAILQRLQAEFDSPPEALQTLVGLLSEGAPVPYVYRHCRERVPGMSEDRMHAVEERLHQLEETEQRKDAIRQQAEARGTLTEDLQKTLEGSFDQDLLDDIYQSLRPRRRTPAMVAEEQGLGALAQAVQHRQLGEKSLVDVAAEYVDAEKGLETTERVLEGVALILAERFASDPDVRDTFRRELSKGILKATAVQPGRRGAQRYKQFFDMSEPVRRIQPQRMLALRRAEREGVLKVELCLPEGREKEILRERFAADVEAGSVLAEFLDVVFQTAYDAHLRKACERDIRRRIKERADRETVRNTVRTMRSLLMAPPLGGKKVLSLRATSMTLWAALVEEDGGMAEGKTITLGLQEARKAKKPRKPKAAAKPKDGEAPAENAEAKAADGEAPAENAEAAPETPDTASAETPAAETPAAETPAAETPAAETPAAETPAAETPTTEPPTENAAEAAPAEAATTNTGPAEATPAEATPVEEAPAETAEASADAPAPADATPADATPAEATPAEATPAEATADSTETEATPEGGEPSAEAATPEGEAAPEAAPTEPAAPAMSEEERKAKNEVLRAAGVNWVKEVVEKHSPAAIAIPHGRRQSVTERMITPLLKQLPAETRPMLIPVDEAASHIYATSGAGRKRDQRVEVGVRTAASLARRLQDPLQELLKMDNRNLGLGQSLDEVHQGLLQRHLDATVASCLAEIGIDINTAGVDLLQRLPLIDREQAEKIASFRKKNQGFRSLAQLKEVGGIDDDRFRYVAGFFRLLGGDEPLDATAIHPDLYDSAKRMAEARGAKIEDLLGKNDLRFQQEDVDETTPEAAARSILRDLAAAGSDPRGEMAIAANEGITSLGQLQNQMELKARVTNLTDFGAFVDVGIGQDGLVHISQIPGKRRSEENALRIGEAVTVWVLGVDLEKRKISLSMFPPRQEGEGRRGGGGRRRSGRFEGERGQERGRGRGGRDGGGRGRGGRDGGSRDGGGRGRGGRDGDRRGRTPRVITVESERKLEEAKGHKGEFKSLSGLRALINKDKKSDEG